MLRAGDFVCCIVPGARSLKDYLPNGMKNTTGFPTHVKLGLLGIHNRTGALVQLWLSVGISLALLVIFGLFHDSFLWSIIFVLSTLLTFNWLWSCIRWVDRKGRWEK